MDFPTCIPRSANAAIIKLPNEIQSEISILIIFYIKLNIMNILICIFSVSISIGSVFINLKNINRLNNLEKEIAKLLNKK